jgi:hypothetical protein
MSVSHRVCATVLALVALSSLGCDGDAKPGDLGAPADAAPSAFTVMVGGEQNVIPPGSPGLPFIPDEHFSYLRQPDGSYRMWVSAGGTSGTLAFATPDLLALTSLKTAGGLPAGVLVPSGPGTAAFDADYAGAGSVFVAANGSDLLMIYHAENHLFGGTDYPGSPFYASIGLARSSDGGLTWQRQGQILSGLDPQQASQAATGAGALTPSAIETGGYIYVVFREIDLQSNTQGLALARAPIASDGAPGSWQKWSQGSFSTPGLGGAFSPLPLVLDPSDEGDRRQPFLSFNSYLQAFVLTIVGNGGIYLATSTDLLTWSDGQVALPAPVPDGTVIPSKAPYNWYPTLVSPDQASEATTDQTGYLYYAKGANDGTSHHTMYRRPFTLTLSP